MNKNSLQDERTRTYKQNKEASSQVVLQAMVNERHFTIEQIPISGHSLSLTENKDVHV